MVRLLARAKSMEELKTIYTSFSDSFDRINMVTALHRAASVTAIAPKGMTSPDLRTQTRLLREASILKLCLQGPHHKGETWV